MNLPATSGEAATGDPAAAAPRRMVLTGASSPIGREIALCWARPGDHLVLVGRHADRELEAAAERLGAVVDHVEVDLGDRESCAEGAMVLATLGPLNALVFASGHWVNGAAAVLPPEVLDTSFDVIVRSPYALCRALSEPLEIASGTIVFINSTRVLLPAIAEQTIYTTCKAALRAMADGLRAELNPRGVAVCSLILGSTATPLQERIAHERGEEYHGSSLVQPRDVGSAVRAVLELGPTAEATDLVLRPRIHPSLRH